MFYYTAFGFTIASEIYFPELFVNGISKPPDVRIRRGTTPRSLDESATADPNLWINPDQYLIHINEVAWYYVENGNLVIAEPYAEAEEKSIRLFLLCNAMAAIIHQRKLIPLHASGVISKNGVALIIGHSGAGKSTTIKALTEKGHSIFTDDVCVLRSCEGKVTAIPSYPMMKLWENSFALLGLGEKDEANRLRSGMDKYGVFFHDQFVPDWKPVIKIFNIANSGNAEEAMIKKQNNIEAFVAIGENTYRSQYVEPMKLNAVHFGMVSDLLKQCNVYKITRPVDTDSVSQVVAIIEKELL